jgi:hypothetical protein
MADCFIIMPVSTPEHLVATYGGDKDHFQHVLDCLFIPAVEKAGLNPIPPIAEGADMIHAGIIQNLQQAGMVLCDMSSLNANVFFELGIRTAVGKPICLVKDELTSKVPFDIGIINYETYASALPGWAIQSDIEMLAKHLIKSAERSPDSNTLWKHFGLKVQAHLPSSKPENEISDRLELLTAQVEGVAKRFDNLSKGGPSEIALWSPVLADYIWPEEANAIVNIMATSGAKLRKAFLHNGRFVVTVDDPRNLSSEDIKVLNEIAIRHKVELFVSGLNPK